MNNLAILNPVFVVVFLTFAVAFWMGRQRLGAIGRGDVRMSHFRVRSADPVPPRVAQASNNYSNLLELPILFYALAALMLVTEQADDWQVGLAWAFALSRVAHSLIHLTYNNVTHRFLAFAIGMVVLLVMWVRFLLQVGG